jgi:serine/threonine protein kinase
MTDEILLNDRYRLEKPLGQGGMSVVYRARDLTLERTVAIKILREDYSRDKAFRTRFQQEAKAAANLSHPNIVTVHDFGIDRERLFIVMEYIHGSDMNSILQARGRFSVAEAVPLILQACAGIGYAHRAGLVHCDIKPHNFIITPDNRVKVTDFGIARALASINPDEKFNVVWGSPQYFSPEQAAGEAPSTASDVYSLGVVIYQMLTGRLPFTASSTTQLVELHQHATAVPPSHYNTTIPPTLEKIILKVLSKEPSARYRTADQLGRVLMSFSEQIAPSGATPPAGTVISKSAGLEPEVQKTKRSPSPIQAVKRTAPAQSLSAAPPAENPLDIDWLSIGLGVLALLAVGGLIPFWLWIYFIYRPPSP